MYGVIKIELINGSHIRQSKPRPWVAELTGFDEMHRYRRRFVNGVDDYSYTSKSGARGIYRYFALRPGAYEVYKAVSWKHDKRYFVLVNQSGDVSEIDKGQVDKWLKNAISE